LRLSARHTKSTYDAEKTAPTSIKEDSMGQLDGKTAIVTGATSGIGARIAEIFVEQGARVLAAGRRTEEGLALVARCGNAMTFLCTDVTDEANVKTLVDHAVATFGRLD
jgi:NAD(P)-dependent dehydrogenase (short-subunit alcohol dehydrogenase family)